VNDSTSRRSAHWAAAALLILVALAAYANSCRSGFVLDSEYLVLMDRRVHHCDLSNLHAILNRAYWFPEGDTSLYRPLATFSWMVNYAILGNRDQPLGYHLVNLALHLLNVFLLWWLALSVQRRRLAAFFAAAVFAVHPIATEAVTYIGGRPDLMAAAAVLGGLLLYARGAETGGRRRTPVEAGLCILAAAGMACKEGAVILPALMLLYDAALRPGRLREWRNAVSCYAAAGFGIAMELAVRYTVLSKLRAWASPFVDNPLLGAGFVKVRLTALGVILRYGKLLLWPRVLSSDYSYNQIGLLSLPAGLLAAAVVLLALGSLGLCYRKSRPVFFFGFFFFVALFPVSNVGLPIGSIMAERFLYLPSAGFAACLAMGIVALAERVLAGRAARYAAAALLGVLVAALGIRTHCRNADWESNRTLWTSASQASPGSFKPYSMLGSLAGRAGDPASLVAGVELAEKSISILGDLPPERSTTLPYKLLGQLWISRGRLIAPSSPAEAAEYYRRAVDAFERGVRIDQALNAASRRREDRRGRNPELLPDTGDGALYTSLGEACKELGRFQDAIDAERQALRLFPAADTVYDEIAGLWGMLGRGEDAQRWAAEAVLLGRRPTQFSKFDRIYRQLHPEGCPATLGPQSLNLDCPAVKAVVCDAERGLLAVFRDAHYGGFDVVYRSNSLTGDACLMER
jgi:protein O-mannosyl-transferase